MPTDSGEGRRRAAEAEPEPEGEGEAARERCPRCLSKDTKFCYYNNYNTAQPRHFCKSCRRYWTVGGALRNVPIGGCSRKRPRRSSSSYAAGPASVTPPAPPADFPAPCAPAGGGFGHLLSSAGFLALGEPFLEGRVGFELGLGLGLGSGPGPTPSVEELGFGLGTSLLWPSSLLDEEIGDTWRIESGAEDCFAAPAAADGWRDLAVSAPGGRRSGGHDHGLN